MPSPVARPELGQQVTAQVTSHAPTPISEITADDLHGFKYFDRLWPLLERLHQVGAARDKAGNRQLHYDQYVSLLLLYFFNPVLTSLRGLQQAGSLHKVQQRLGVKRASLGALSEASHVFDPALLRPLLQELAARARTLEHLQHLQTGQPLQRQQALHALHDLTAVDGTFLHALPRMMWAWWRGLKIMPPSLSPRPGPSATRHVPPEWCGTWC